MSRPEYRFAAGRELPQTTRPELIAVMLPMLDVGRGQRTLEIGTCCADTATARSAWYAPMRAAAGRRPVRAEKSVTGADLASCAG